MYIAVRSKKLKTAAVYHQSSERAQRGFTLVELLVTLSVLAVLLSLAVPSFSETLRGWRRDSATRAFTTHLQLARTQAIKASRKVIMCPSSDGESCTADSTEWKNGWLVYVDLDNDGAIDTGEEIAVRTALSGVASMSGTDAVEELIFLPSGLMGSSATTVTVKPSGSTSTKVNEIAISRVGRAQVTSKDQS
ncbi:MAG: general secretion pathway protein GspH [Betaproteobacteria bacterium HGW-Betaproteobacteria-9]|nr:MAG: general secretion pathway protein GspH [Betaproteobacteria bacterium HGW-Betaproteobacteria-9]